MNTSGWIFLVGSWALVIGITAWCLVLVVTSRKHWRAPDQDIERLHHGEFSGEDREAVGHAHHRDADRPRTGSPGKSRAPTDQSGS